MADHKYWVQFVLLVQDTASGAPQEFLDVMGVTLKLPISDFEHVNAVATMIANVAGRAHKAAPGAVQVKVLSWTKLEEGTRIHTVN